jgi:hypothetical protein
MPWTQDMSQHFGSFAGQCSPQHLLPISQTQPVVLLLRRPAPTFVALSPATTLTGLVRMPCVAGNGENGVSVCWRNLGVTRGLLAPKPAHTPFQTAKYQETSKEIGGTQPGKLVCLKIRYAPKKGYMYIYIYVCTYCIVLHCIVLHCIACIHACMYVCILCKKQINK